MCWSSAVAAAAVPTMPVAAALAVTTNLVASFCWVVLTLSQLALVARVELVLPQPAHGITVKTATAAVSETSLLVLVGAAAVVSLPETPVAAVVAAAKWVPVAVLDSRVRDTPVAPGIQPHVPVAVVVAVVVLG